MWFNGEEINQQKLKSVGARLLKRLALWIESKDLALKWSIESREELSPELGSGSTMKNLFSAKMKELRKERGLTQKAVANALGIGQTTVANYENGSRFPDLEKLSEVADFYKVTVDELLGRLTFRQQGEMEERNSRDQPLYEFQDYMKSLIDVDKMKIREIVLNLIDSNLSLHEIYKNYLVRALKETGTLWEKEEMPIWKEHFISETTLEYMALIKSQQITEIETVQPLLAIVPGAETHSIGIRMISDELEMIGYQVIFLGNNIPADNILAAIRENKPAAVLMSVTMRQHIDSVTLLIDKIKQSFGTNAPAILIGGAAFEQMNYVEMVTGADKYCKDYQDIEKNLKRI